MSSTNELAPKVKSLLDQGAPASNVREALARKYDMDTVNSVMTQALSPKIQGLRDQGVSDDQIMGALQSKGIVPTAPYSSNTDFLNQGLSQDQIGQKSPVTETTGAPTSIIPQSSEPNLVQPQAPTAQLDPNKPMPVINVNQDDEAIMSDLRNLRHTYKELGMGLVAWSELSPEMTREYEQMKTESSAFMLAQLRKRGINAVDVDGYGAITVQDPETGETKVYEEGIIDSLLANKFEIAGAVIGGIRGGIAGAPLGPVGIAAGATTMGAAGAMMGRGADLIDSARDVNYELSMRELTSKMHDAGVADITFGMLGATAAQTIRGTIKGGKIAGRGLQRAYDLFVGGNKEGAQQAILDSFNLTPEQAFKVVQKWEGVSGNKVLSKKALANEALTEADSDALLRVITETDPRATEIVKAAASASKSAGSKLSAAIDKRAQEVITAVSNTTNENLGAVLQQRLGDYTDGVKSRFADIKTIGTELMKDADYRFNFDTATFLGQLRKQAKGIHDGALRKDFYTYLDQVKEIGNDEAAAKLTKEFEAQTGAKNVTIKTGSKVLESTNPYRSFNDLLELRSVVNQLSSDRRFKSFVDFKQMETARNAIDTEIAKAATEHMPNGQTWLKQWGAANQEYHKMKVLERNALYKVLTNPTLDADKAVRAVTKSMGYDDPGIFMQVMGKLPERTRVSVEGAVLKHLVEKHTVGFEGGAQAIGFTRLASDLDKLGFTQQKARDLKRVVKQFADVYKNDPHLLAAAGNIPLPKFQSYLTADPVIRVKYELASTVFNAVKSRIPFSSNAGRAAILHNMSKLLDNPLDAKSTQMLLKELPDDPALKTQLHKLSIQFVEQGKPENYGKVPTWRVSKAGEFNKASDTALGKGVLFYTDKEKAQRIARETGAKLTEKPMLYKTIATPEQVEEVIGRKPKPSDYRDPEVMHMLQDKEIFGVAVDDKVLLFK